MTLKTLALNISYFRQGRKLLGRIKNLKNHTHYMPNRIYLISGTISSGKDTLLRKLRGYLDFYLIRSTTTRAPRTGEKDGESYQFVDKNEFIELALQNEFIEFSEKYGDYYGITRNEIQRALSSKKDIFVKVDEKGVRRLKRVFPQAVSIFIAPPSLGELRHRINMRGDADQGLIFKRLMAAHNQIQGLTKSRFDHIIVNSNINNAIQEILNRVLV